MNLAMKSGTCSKWPSLFSLKSLAVVPCHSSRPIVRSDMQSPLGRTTSASASSASLKQQRVDVGGGITSTFQMRTTGSKKRKRNEPIEIDEPYHEILNIVASCETAWNALDAATQASVRATAKTPNLIASFQIKRARVDHECVTSAVHPLRRARLERLVVSGKAAKTIASLVSCLASVREQVRDSLIDLTVVGDVVDLENIDDILDVCPKIRRLTVAFDTRAVIDRDSKIPEIRLKSSSNKNETSPLFEVHRHLLVVGGPIAVVLERGRIVDTTLPIGPRSMGLVHTLLAIDTLRTVHMPDENVSLVMATELLLSGIRHLSVRNFMCSSYVTHDHVSYLELTDWYNMRERIDAHVRSLKGTTTRKTIQLCSPTPYVGGLATVARLLGLGTPREEHATDVRLPWLDLVFASSTASEENDATVRFVMNTTCSHELRLAIELMSECQCVSVSSVNKPSSPIGCLDLTWKRGTARLDVTAPFLVSAYESFLFPIVRGGSRKTFVPALVPKVRLVNWDVASVVGDGDGRNVVIVESNDWIVEEASSHVSATDADHEDEEEDDEESERRGVYKALMADRIGASLMDGVRSILRLPEGEANESQYRAVARDLAIELDKAGMTLPDHADSIPKLARRLAKVFYFLHGQLRVPLSILARQTGNLDERASVLNMWTAFANDECGYVTGHCGHSNHCGHCGVAMESEDKAIGYCAAFLAAHRWIPYPHVQCSPDSPDSPDICRDSPLLLNVIRIVLRYTMATRVAMQSTTFERIVVASIHSLGCATGYCLDPTTSHASCDLINDDERREMTLAIFDYGRIFSQMFSFSGTASWNETTTESWLVIERASNLIQSTRHLIGAPSVCASFALGFHAGFVENKRLESLDPVECDRVVREIQRRLELVRRS